MVATRKLIPMYTDNVYLCIQIRVSMYKDNVYLCIEITCIYVHRQLIFTYIVGGEDVTNIFSSSYVSFLSDFLGRM